MITKAYLKDLPKHHNLALSISSPMNQITCSQHVKELIPPSSSYVVIPSTPTIFIYNTDQIILGTLPHTKNMLVDLTLPFYYQGNQCEQGNYFARYLMYDQRLIGIKVSCATKTLVKDSQNFKRWPFKKTVNYTLSRNILQFYKRSAFPQNTYNKIIKVGDFILTFRNIRILMLFESQLKTVQSLLGDCKQLGADIVSIVCDMPREKMFENKLRSINYTSSTAIENHLKQFARSSKKVVMYTGCRSAPLTQLYLVNPFIIHYKLPEVRMQPHFLNKGGSISVLCNIKPNLKMAPGVKDKPNHIKPIPNLVIDATLKQIKSASAGKYKRMYPQNWAFYGAIPEEMQQILKKMHLWYIYNSVNEGQPFICPFPLQNMNQFILKSFKEITAYNNKVPGDFLLFYKLERDQIITDEQESCGVKIYESLNQLLTEQKREKYFIFTNDTEQINLLQRLVRSNNKIFICQRDIFMEQQTQKHKQIESIDKRIINFAQKVMNLELFSLKKIYKENKSSANPLTKDQLRVSIFDHLKPAIRSSYRPIPFFTYLKQLNERQLVRILDSIEQQIQNQENKNTSFQIQNKSQNNSITGIQSYSADSNPRNKDFLQNLESMKKLYGDERRSVQAQCHRCQKYHAKNVLKDCERCHIRTCFLCFQVIKGQRATPQNIEECLTCRKLCFCPFCMKKKKKFQKQKQRIQASTAQIKSLSLIHTQKTLEQLQQIKIKQWLQKESCQICQIEGRMMMFMKISCTTCDSMKCFNCVKAQQKGDRQFIQNWQCDRCKPPETPKHIPIITQFQQERVQPNLQQQRRDNQRRSPFHSQSPKRQRRQNQNKETSPPKQNKRKRLGSPSNSRSPVINRQNNRVCSPPKSGSPKRQNNKEQKKRLRSPSQSGSVRIQKQSSINQQKNNNKRQGPRSPSNSTSNKSAKQKNKQRLHSPSDQGSNKSAKNRNNNLSNSRAREMTKKQASEIDTDSKPLWGNKSSYSSNEIRDNRNNNQNYQDRGGRNFNNQWKDRNNNNYRGRGSNYSNRGGNRNNNYQDRNNIRNSDERRNDNNQNEEVQQKILNIESQYNYDNIDY